MRSCFSRCRSRGSSGGWPVMTASGVWPGIGSGASSNWGASEAPMAAEHAPSAIAGQRIAGGIELPASRLAAVSTASDSAPASIQPRTGVPRSSAITTPSPMARSRAPKARASTFTGRRAASEPIHMRPARPGGSTKAAPTARRARA